MGCSNISGALLAGRECILLVHWYDWYDWYDWYEWNNIHSIGNPLVNCISLWGLRIFLGRFWLGGSAFYSSIGTIGTIGTNEISFIPLAIHW